MPAVLVPPELFAVSIMEKRNKMGKFDGVLICTDLDGTLFKNDKTVSLENKKAIEYFKSEGGLFTFVTGRMPRFARDVFEIVNPNAPVGCVNGAGLYDYVRNEYIWKAEIHEKVCELVRLVDENFPEIGIQVNTYDTTYFSKENEVMKHFRKVTGAENLVCGYMDVKEPIAKIVFGVITEEEMKGLGEMLKSHPLAGNFDFIRSERYLYEILPKGIGKGTSVQKLCEKLGIDINKTVAVGDYNNDISMFHAAKVAVAVANASEDAKKAADYITVSNEEHAIAKVISDLENSKYGI